MGLLSSIGRFFSSLFGLAEGATERASDSLVSGSPDAIRNQFRKTKEDAIREFNQMRDAVADLIRIRESRIDEVKRLNKESDELEGAMQGAIARFKQTQDERFRGVYTQLAAKNEAAEERIKELTAEVEVHDKQITVYKSKLSEFQKHIEGLSREEAETVADIVSSKRIKELNDRLAGIGTSVESKNLEAIREARQKAKATAKLSAELHGESDLIQELKSVGTSGKHMAAFDVAVGIAPQKEAFSSTPQIEAKPKDAIDAEIDSLLKLSK